MAHQHPGRRQFAGLHSHVNTEDGNLSGREGSARWEACRMEKGSSRKLLELSTSWGQV